MRERDIYNLLIGTDVLANDYPLVVVGKVREVKFISKDEVRVMVSPRGEEGNGYLFDIKSITPLSMADIHGISINCHDQ